MTEIELFLKDLEKPNSDIVEYFSDKKLLIRALKELDSLIGMRKIKSQILKQIKTFISSKKMGIYKDKDRKHCLLCGPPGCGKTTVGKILCKIWVGIGFINNKQSNKRVTCFNKLQDELLRNQREQIRDLKKKNKLSMSVVMEMNTIHNINKGVLNKVISNKTKINTSDYDLMYNSLTKVNSIAEKSQENIKQIFEPSKSNISSIRVAEEELMDTKEDYDLPFYSYNRNDVVSRYVGDTTHRTTKAMNAALDGVAYFDEAYNLCNDSFGMSDSYGRSALTTINQFMDEYSDRLIVVFSGYKNEIYNNLFKVQRGLESRFTQKFDIENYTSDELTLIYIQRLKYSKWKIENTPELRKIMSDNMKFFKYQGRDMDTLAMYTKNIMSEKIYSYVMSNTKVDTIIRDMNVVKVAIQMFIENMITADSQPSNNLMDLLNRENRN